VAGSTLRAAGDDPASKSRSLPIVRERDRAADPCTGTGAESALSRPPTAPTRSSRNNAAIAADLFLTERADEKHINAIFSKLGLSEEQDVHKLVRATVIYLADLSRQREAVDPPD